MNNLIQIVAVQDAFKVYAIDFGLPKRYHDPSTCCHIPYKKMTVSSVSGSLLKCAGKQIVTQMSTVDLANIKPSDIGATVHVKVYRRWTVTGTKSARQAALCFILLDQQGGAIQANVEAREKARFDKTLQINETYTITGFGLQETKKWMQTLPNHLTMILGKFTDVKPFPGTGFPKHHFNFAAYNELARRADNNDAIFAVHAHGPKCKLGSFCMVGR